MQRSKNKFLLLLVFVCSLFTLASGCAEDELLILHHALPNSSCTFEADARAAGLSRGTHDLYISDRYTLHLTVQNEGDDDVLLREAWLNSASNIPGLDQVLQQSYPRKIELPSPIRVSTGESVQVALEFIDPDINSQLIATSLFAGKNTLVTLATAVSFSATQAGEEVLSNTFTLPLDLCSGCLLFYPPEALKEAANGALTCEPSPNDVPFHCQPGQDVMTDCRICHSVVDNPERARLFCDPK